MDVVNRKVFYNKRDQLFNSSKDIIVGHDEDVGTDNEIYTRTDRNSNRDPATISGAKQGTFTIDDALEAVGFGKYQWIIGMYAGLSWTGDAMEMMILSILGPQLHCEWALPGYKVALITSVVFIGMGVGSPLWGNLSDKYGRRTGLITFMMWTLYFGLLSAFAPTYGWILTLRAFVGFGVSGAPQAVTLYSEFLPVKARGICVMLIGAFWALGAFFEVLLALLVMPRLGWRWLLGLSVIPMAVFVLSCYWLPESPRFDASTGRRDKALKTLQQMAKDNKKSLPKGTLICRNPQTSRGSIKDLFTRRYLRTTLLLWFIWFANAFCYYGIVLLTTEMFQDGDACGSTQEAKSEAPCRLDCKSLTTADYTDLLLTTVAEFPGVLFLLIATERIGRKISMAMGFLLFTLCMLPMYACIGRVSLTILIFVARAAISGGYQVVFVYTPEVFPTEVRALALGTCSGFAKLGALITPFVAQVLLRSSVGLTLSVYWVSAFLAAISSLFLPIETLGRSMQEAGEEPQSATEQAPPSSSTHTEVNVWNNT